MIRNRAPWTAGNTPVTAGEIGLWSPEADVDARMAGDTTRHLALQWIVRLRYGLIAGEVALIAGLYFGLRLRFPLTAIGTAIVFQAFSNILFVLQIHRFRRSAEHIVGTLFILDALCLTLILSLTGGPENPFSLLYLVQITFSAVVLRRLWTWTLGIVSTLSFGLLFWDSRDIPALHDHGANATFSLHLAGMWVAFATAALLISFFVGKLSSESRRKERDILLMQKRLSRSDRLASLITLAAGAAHEISTPLSTIAVTAKEMEHDADSRLHDRGVAEDARLIRSQVERCRRILERMGARGADPFGETPRATDLYALLGEVRNRFPDQENNIEIEVDSLPLPACVIPVRAAVEALSALVKNALDASSGTVPVRVRAIRMDSNKIRFLIHDAGIGMSSEVLERVAEPFFTTKAAGQGMGLGAFLAHLFAQTVGGQLSFESAPGQGCTAILDLPDMKYEQS